MRRAALAQDALRGHPVDLGYDGLEARGRRLFVARRDRLEDLADRVAHFERIATLCARRLIACRARFLADLIFAT